MEVFLLTAAVISLAFFLHPYTIYPLSLKLFGRKRIDLIVGSSPPSATLVFCAYNEAASLPSKIDNLREIRAAVPEVKFACYVDTSSDDTLTMLQDHQDLIDVTAAVERTGKAVGMAKMAAAATTDIMIFTDANVLVEPESVLRLLAYFSDPDVGGVAGKLLYVNEGESEMARTSSTYWRLEEIIKELETRSGSTMGADGSLFATRRELYPYVPSHLMDDFIVSMSVVFAGRRLISAPDVLAYEHAATASADEFRRKRRIACRAYSSHRYISPHIWAMSLLNKYKYISHRWIRWHGFPIGCLSALLVFAWVARVAGVLPASMLLVAGVVVLWAGARLSVKGLRHTYEALKLLAANTLGVADAVAGKRYQIWQPPESRA